MKFSTYFFVFIILLSSCEVIDQEPVSDISSVNFFETASDAEAAIIGCYDGFQGDGFVTMLYVLQPMVASDLTFPSRGGNYTRINTFAVTPTSNGDINALWQRVYRGVHRCNDVLENVPLINDPAIEGKRNRIMGEAYFLRAYHFWHMTRWFGKIPLPLQTTRSLEGLNLPREELNVVYDQILSDLQQAASLLPDNRENRAFASKASARALMARVLLFRNGQGDFENVLENTTPIIANSFYDLVPGANFSDLFRVGKQNTVETIFEISVRPVVEQENQGMDGETAPALGNNFRIRPEEKIINAFAANGPQDLRTSVSLDTIIQNGESVPFINKWIVGPVDQIENRRVQDPNLVMIRYADVLLMHAEALNELGRTSEAIPFLNQVRQRAGIDDSMALTQAEVRQAIKNERMVEFAFEGLRYHDLVRWGDAIDEIEELTDPNKIIWPIIAREIDLNPNLLPQNPGY